LALAEEGISDESIGIACAMLVSSAPFLSKPEVISFQEVIPIIGRAKEAASPAL